MSIPRDSLDQLLSGYLDGTLSGDEQTQIDQLMRDDPQVAQELGELQDIQGTLREITRIDESTKLDGRFSDRVLSAAIERARSEGLDESHPLIRLAEQPSTETTTRRVPWGRIASGLVALAASIAVAIVVLKPEQPATVVPSVADAQPGATFSPNGLLDSSPDVTAIADADADTVSPNALLNTTPNTTPNTTQEPKVAVAADRAPATNGLESPNAATLQSIAEASISVVDANKRLKAIEERILNGEVVSDAEALSAISGLGLLPVIEVKLTEAGRLSGVVRELMQNCQIRPAEEKVVSDQLVGILSQTIEASDRGVQVLYLEVPSKKTDYLQQSLAADTDRVESVKFGVIAAPKVQRFMKSLKQVNPTEVRHTSWQFQSRVAGALASSVSNGKLKPFKATGPLPALSTNQDVPDQLAQVLVLVR